ncbi:hypothetical protein NA78x_003415 [Anatilimnocola sp. NA78]|uniref:hypothetical protein n=1 Tax=Anatilimnocola sp. NA78 TaxID=3415683 RepID=UPI003CE59883
MPSTNTEKHPKSPLSPQTQCERRLDSKMTQEPRYQAPLYKGGDKLNHKVAVITEGDSRIGRAIAILDASSDLDSSYISGELLTALGWETLALNAKPAGHDS